MTGAQLAFFSFLVLVLPLVALLAFWLQRRYTAAIVRLQADGRAPEGAPAAPAAEEETEPRSAGRHAPALHLHVEPAGRVSPAGARVGRWTGAAGIRRRVILVDVLGSLVYWGALVLLAVTAAVGRLTWSLLRTWRRCSCRWW